VKEKFGQEMRLADEANDRIRAVHTNTHLEQLHLLRQAEQEAVAALLAKQQHEIDGLIQVQARELERARGELDRQFEDWKGSLQSQVRPPPPPSPPCLHLCRLRWQRTTPLERRTSRSE
jgi:hypothetical protein